MALLYSLLGDSNIRRYVNKNSCRANPALQAAQVIACGHLGIFSESLSSVRAESTGCILSCLTNFISSADGPESVSQRVEPVLHDIRDSIFAACEANPSRSYFVSPPMYRTHPVWYREGLPEVLTLFSSTLSSRPENLHILPSFPTPEFDSDGVHLTAYSSLEFILHLFDASVELLASLDLDPDASSARGSEATRVLEDRVMVLEQDHRRLNKVVEIKTAIDAELADFHENERMENWLVIEGLPRISDDLIGKAWQDQALKDVQAALHLLMGRKCPIVFVKNSTSRAKDAVVVYSVKMPDIKSSEDIRKKFGSFFLSGRGEKRPDSLLHINIKNRVTEETKTRISILKLMAKRYRDSNPGSRVQVISYDPRPLIKITPASDASDRRIKVYNFIEAVKNLPSNFSPAELEPILRRILIRLVGSVRSIFVVLSDDQFRQRIAKFPSTKKAATPSQPSNPSEADPNVVSVASDQTSTSVQPTVHRSRSGKRGNSSGQGGTAKKSN